MVCPVPAFQYSQVRVVPLKYIAVAYLLEVVPVAKSKILPYCAVLLDLNQTAKVTPLPGILKAGILTKWLLAALRLSELFPTAKSVATHRPLVDIVALKVRSWLYIVVPEKLSKV